MATGVGKPNTRTLYISSEDVDWYQSSSLVTVNLPQSIVPDDGYMLAYALKSIGMNTSVMNISNNLRNNRLRVLVHCDITNLLFYPVRGDVITNGRYNLIAEDKEEWKKKKNTPFPCEKVIVQDENTLIYEYAWTIPDGLYSLSDLFSYLSGNTDDQLHIPLPEYYDISDAKYTINAIMNIVRKRFRFELTPSGFKIGLDNSQRTTAKPSYTIGGTSYDKNQLFPQAFGISLLPDRNQPSLYETLFTNYNSTSAKEPISALSREGRSGKNPPSGIYFQFDKYEVRIKEIGNEHHYDIPNGVYPTGEKINRSMYIAYNHPILDPLYVDINISLPNHSIDGRGETNRLVRMFTLGNMDSTSHSYFRQWETPKVTTMDSVSGFNSVTVQFASEGDKWDFFNLEFAIELEIYQVMIEPLDGPSDAAAELIRTMPDDDPVTRAIANTPELARTKENHYSTAHVKGGVVKRARHGE